jgi:hypothetical protein
MGVQFGHSVAVIADLNTMFSSAPYADVGNCSQCGKVILSRYDPYLNKWTQEASLSSPTPVPGMLGLGLGLGLELKILIGREIVIILNLETTKLLTLTLILTRTLTPNPTLTLTLLLSLTLNPTLTGSLFGDDLQAGYNIYQNLSLLIVSQPGRNAVHVYVSQGSGLGTNYTLG